MINKIIFIAPLIAVIVGALTMVAPRAYADAGGDAGVYYARLDFENSAGYHGSCAQHGIDVVQDPGYCISFKLAYAAQWAVLVAGQ